MQLSRLQEFSFLSALDNLAEIDVEHNPFVETARQMRFNYRPFLLFLLQHLTRLNATPVTQVRVCVSVWVGGCAWVGGRVGG